MRRQIFCVLLVTLCFTAFAEAQKLNANQKLSQFLNKSNSHSNNWAVIVCTSRFWFNYRHIANSLSIYHILKQNGVPDSNIILMLADDMACNPRNSFPAQIFNNQNRNTNLYGENVEVDYRGYEVTIENFLRVLTDRHTPDTPRNKRLTTDEHSNILIYMSGHGGNEFLKFQDSEEINSADIADALEQMHLKKRYNEVLFMVDTCQAGTLFNQFKVPGVVSIGSSSYAQNSYSHHSDYDIGVAVIDRFTHDTLEFFEQHFSSKASTESRNRIAPSLQELFSSYSPSKLNSNPRWTSTLQRPLHRVPISDFFGSNIKISFMESKPYRLANTSAHILSAEREAYTDGEVNFTSTSLPLQTESSIDEEKQVTQVQGVQIDFYVVASVALLVLLYSIFGPRS